MRILTFQARRFWWKSFSKTLEGVEDVQVEEEVKDAVVAFVHVEEGDEEERVSVVRKALKHLKWIANKRELRTVVLHSFAHLGAENSSPEFAEALFAELRERLEGSDYAVRMTPFGYFCEWDLGVYGESLAKVWKQL